MLISTDVDRIPEAAQAIAEIDGVEEVYSVTGGIDLIAVIRVRAYVDLAPVISDRINKVAGIRQTDTHLALRTCSQQDLDAGFALGLDG